MRNVTSFRSRCPRCRVVLMVSGRCMRCEPLSVDIYVPILVHGDVRVSDLARALTAHGMTITNTDRGLAIVRAPNTTEGVPPT